MLWKWTTSDFISNTSLHSWNNSLVNKILPTVKNVDIVDSSLTCGSLLLAQREEWRSEWGARCQWLLPAILATWEADIRRIVIWGHPGGNSSQDPIFKITRAKWTGGVAQAVECLLCKLKALSSNPNPTKKHLKSEQGSAFQKLTMCSQGSLGVLWKQKQFPQKTSIRRGHSVTRTEQDTKSLYNHVWILTKHEPPSNHICDQMSPNPGWF
jgi:hypothetical protein